MDRKISFLVLTAVVVSFFSSCSNEEIYDPTKAAELKKAQYEAAFVQRYGAISPNQDWGFGVNPSTRGAVTDWATKYNLEAPDDWEYLESKTEEIKKLFQHPDPAYVVDNLDWSDFFVQHVWHDNGGNMNMNQLKVHKAKGDEGELANNLNKAARSMMFMADSGTASFSYQGDDGQRYSQYIILCFEGNYYVGFDYEKHINGDEGPDGDYSDWIVKITPAKYKAAQRVFAEDLGDIGDFDFNDVVFDAAIVKDDNNQDVAVITLQAAGGTMPLYIGKESPEYEVHNRFGVSTGTMVNTAPGKHQDRAPVVFRLSGYSNIADIPIIVNGMALKAEMGAAPGKLCVPTTTDWADERQSIEDRYPNFTKYVNDPTIKWWEEE